MRTLAAVVTLSALTAGLGACQQAAAPRPPAAVAMTEAEAAKLADATVATWASMDAAKIKALYAPAVEAFDYAVPGLAVDRAEFDRRQDAFVASKMDKFVQKERKLQVLDADTMVMSGLWDGFSSAKPANNGAIRCTDVFEKQADGAWLIANEHCSMVPKATA